MAQRKRTRTEWIAAGLVVALFGCEAKPRQRVAAPSRQARLAERADADTRRVEELGAQPEQLGSLRERAIAVIERSARDESPQARVNALEALSQVPSRLEPIAREALFDENLGVRSVGALVVGQTELHELKDEVRPLLEDRSPFVRASAIYALAALGEPVDRTPLADMLLRADTAGERAHAAFVLGELGDRSALPLLRQAGAESPTRATRAELSLLWLQIAEAMVKLGDERPLQGIRAALYPSRPEELESTALAVQILGEIRDRGAIDQLIYMSGYRDSEGNLLPGEIRLGIASALARMGLSEGGFIADEHWASGERSVRALAADVYGWTLRMEHLPRLERMMEDPDVRVRIAASAGALRVVESRSGLLSGVE